VTRPDATHAAKTILVCEDDSNLRTLVRLALGDGYRIIEAADGNEALELVRAVKPDLIVLDLMLPGRSGLELLSAIRRENGHARTPVVVISAWAHSDEAAVAAGADRFVAKPFDPDELQTTVAELLEDNGRRG
jgi:two-component system, OmpR family, phosphate regulon response regulator PhoB